MSHGWEPLGEDALLLRLYDGQGDCIDITTNRKVHLLATRLAAGRPSWLRDIVPAYASLAIFIDLDAFDDDTDTLPLDIARGWLDTFALEAVPNTHDPLHDAVLEIPTCYEGDCGPDVIEVARHAGLTTAEVIARHASATYTVAMIGFAPGFPYLLGLDPALSMPRRDTPRARVPAGSVAIGGAQTGIYPRDSPGGWQLIGRTPLRLFDATQPAPSLLQPGQRLRFVPLPLRDFEQAISLREVADG